MMFGWLAIGVAQAGLGDRCVDEGTLPPHERVAVEGILGPSMRLAELERLLAAHPGCAAVWMAQAGHLHREGRGGEAVEALTRAVAEGEWPEAVRALAVALHHESEAGEVLNEAIASNPDDGLLELLRAAEHPISERPGLLVEAVRRHPDDLDVAMAAVDALADAGRPMEAIALGRERNAHLDAPELTERIEELNAPFAPPPPPRDRRPAEFRTLPDGTEEVVVFSPAKARRALDERLAELGWSKVKPIAGGMRYRSTKPLQPFIEVFDDGRIELQKEGLVSTPKENSLGEGQSMIPLISRRKLRPRRTAAMENIWFEVTSWRQALIRTSFQKQLGEVLPDQLTALWEQGRPMYGKGVVEGFGARRAALLDYWATRACSPDGGAARAVVETFLLRVVQDSEHPLTVAEVAGANRQCPCTDATLMLDETGQEGVE